MAQEIDTSQIIETTAKSIYELIKANSEDIGKMAQNIVDKAENLTQVLKKFTKLQTDYLEQKKHINELIKKIKKLNIDIEKQNADVETIQKEIDEKEAKQAQYLIKKRGIKVEAENLYSREGKKYEEALLKLQLASYDLQNKFAELQNKEFVIDYVVYNRGRPIIYRFPYSQFEKMISFDSRSLSKGLLSKIQFSKKQLETMINNGIKIQRIGDNEENLSNISKHAHQIQRIYRIAYQRYDKNPRGIVDVKLAKFEKTHKVLNFSVSNKGDLAEGYVRFLYVLKKFNDNVSLDIQGTKYEEAEIFWINEKSNDDIKKHDEMHLFDFLVRGVMPVTNQSGFFTEDVTTLTKEGKILESAVKFGNANPLQLAQVIQLSNQILSLLKNDIDEQKFIKYLNNDTLFFKGHGRNGVLPDEISKGSKLTAEKEVYEYLKTIITTA